MFRDRPHLLLAIVAQKRDSLLIASRRFEGFRAVKPQPYNWRMALSPFLDHRPPAALDRLTLLLNHIVSSEPVAQSKLRPFSGRIIDIGWSRSLHPTAQLPGRGHGQPDTHAACHPVRDHPAGLFERIEPRVNPSGAAGEPTTAHLTLTIQLKDPLTMATRAIKGERPEVNIDGDAGLAEAASWLMKNLRWDVEDDVARWMGAAPAQLLGQLTSGIKQAIERWRP